MPIILLLICWGPTYCFIYKFVSFYEMGVGTHRVVNNFGEHICFWKNKVNAWEFCQRFMCCWYYSLCFLFMWLYFPCVTLHFVSSSYLEYSVRWLEFICLCFSHHFRYFMIFSAKVDIEFVFDALYWWAVPSSLLFHLDQIEWLWWCDYLAFDKSCVYIFVIFLYAYDSMPNGYVIVSAKHTNL